VPSQKPFPEITIKTIDDKLLATAVCPLTIFNCLDDIDVVDINSFVLKLLPQSFLFKSIQAYG
jgi:hypothetical protein